MPQKHLFFERVKFGFANQGEHETIDQYVVRLRQLAESCEFEGLCESLILIDWLLARKIQAHVTGC